MVVSGGFMRKPSARVGTAAYWLEVFYEQVERERALRPPLPPDKEAAEAQQGAPSGGKAPQLS